MKKCFFIVIIICLLGAYNSKELLASDKGGLELPEVTILGKDVSVFESPEAYSIIPQAGKKERIDYWDVPLSPAEEKKSSFKNVTVSAGRYGTVTSGVDWAGMAKSIDYLIQTKYARTDGYRDHGSEELINPVGNVGIQVMENTRVSGEYGYFHKSMDLPGLITHPTPLSSRENESHNFDVGFESSPLQEIRMTGNFFGTTSQTDENQVEESLDDHFLGFSTTLSRNILHTGMDFWSEKLDRYYSYQKVSGFLGFSDLEVFDNFISEGQFKVDYYEGLGARIDPEFSFSWYLNDRLSVSAKIQRNLRVRSWSESYLSEYYVEGNTKEIRPERELGENVTLSYLILNGLTGSVSLFEKRVKDFFIWQDPDQNGLYSLMNLPDAEITGVSFGLNAELLSNLSLFTLLTVQDPQGKKAGFQEIPYVPEYKWEGGLDWKLPCSLELGTKVSYTGTQFVDVGGADEINDYVLWDMTASYRWRSATFFVKILNVLDQRYDFFLGYPGPDTQYQFGVNVEF